MKVPFNDLHAQYLSVKSEIDRAMQHVIQNSAFVRGPVVEAFEEAFAELIGVEHCVSCANGTDALYIAMRALRLQTGDEVIVPAHSWISTSATVTQAGGRAVFCDTRDSDFTIDVSQIEELITAKTVGIIPVHLYGHPAQMQELMRIAKKHKLWVIEDCAQAHLATFNGKLVGQFGDVATFSFYPGKNLGAMGDAGALVTHDGDIARRAARFARHGGLEKGLHEIEGINSRMDGLQAAILKTKMPYLRSWTEKRNAIAKDYSVLLRDVETIKIPSIAAGASHVWHLFVIRSDQRDALKVFLEQHDIQTAIHYPVALPFLEAYGYLGAKSVDFPVAHNHQNEILSLPIYPEMTSKMVQYVAEKILEFSK